MFLSSIQVTDISSNRNIISNVTKMHSILVDEVFIPKNREELQAKVKIFTGSISIGWGRYSMGWQIASEHTLHIDTRKLNTILDFNQEKKEITVEAWTTWKDIQKYVDPYNLSVQIMQSYANFTVGWSVSVNVHGRYMGYGPLIYSIKRVGVLLLDGTYVDSSPTNNKDIFYSVIGGYGWIWIITDVTLALSDNTKIERISKKMKVWDYPWFFKDSIRDNKNIIFHNADIYPDGYDNIRSISYVTSDAPLTQTEKLKQVQSSYSLEQFFVSLITTLPGGKNIRQYILDPFEYFHDRVVWRNYEASYDVIELEPKFRETTTYFLQEYFIPVDHFLSFETSMKKIFQEHAVNVVNVSVRHALSDPWSLLAWAKQEVFAFVIYYKQWTDFVSQQEVKAWTQELTQTAIEYEGSYYLPYQIYATYEQFLKAYPDALRFFALKKKYDPEYRLKNKLWDTYYLPFIQGNNEQKTKFLNDIASVKNYLHNESQTLYTFPEWFIVYTFDDLAAFMKTNGTSTFPYFTAMWQYWKTKTLLEKNIQTSYPTNPDYELMLRVIWISHSIAMIWKW
jgi:FAD/FMN-containing dehydrogenase